MRKYLYISFALLCALGIFSLPLLRAQTVSTPPIFALACANNTIIPTPASGQFFLVQCNSSGQLLTNGLATTGGTLTGPLTLPAGSISTPALTIGSGQGWYSPTSGQLWWESGGTATFLLYPGAAVFNGTFYANTTDGAQAACFAGGENGIRYVFTATQAQVEGVDFTCSVSYQPLFLDGSELRFAISGTTAWKLDTSGNITDQGSHFVKAGAGYTDTSAVPVLSSCGSTTNGSVAAGSNNSSGNITFGTVTPTACTITFATAYPAFAFCTFSAANAAAAAATTLPYISAQSKTAFTITIAAGTTPAFNYTCTGQ